MLLPIQGIKIKEEKKEISIKYIYNIFLFDLTIFYNYNKNIQMARYYLIKTKKISLFMINN